MSNNNNRDLLTTQQKLELLTSVPHFRMTNCVISAIQSNHSYYKIKSIILKCAPLSLQEKDWYYFWKAMLIYELPVELVKKLMQNNISMSAIHTICEALNDECISLKDLEILADYSLNKSSYYSESSSKQLDLIFAILKCGISFDKIIELFAPDFDIKKMLKFLFETKLDFAVKNGKINSVQKNEILSKYTSQGEMEKILEVIDSDYSFEQILLFANSCYAYSYQIKDLIEEGLSNKAISLVTNSKSRLEADFLYNAFIKAKLNYDDVLYLKQRGNFNESIIEFFSTNSSNLD